MHLKRTEVRKIVPIERKGTKYVARASNNSRKGIPVVIAIRDMLKLARNVKEVRLMVADKLLKLNGRDVRDYKEGISIFNILEADKRYKLTLMKTGRFTLEETKEESRIAKVINKKIMKKGLVQINLHDGTNVLSKEKIKVGDSVELDFKNNIKKILPLEKGKEVFVMSGRSMGNRGKIKEVENKKIRVQLEEREVVLDSSHIIAI
ncbi:hypothetical protein CO038_04025 [Candidatus Pacearchaeota archaeon CG_4_9_14_0_2_um_filter_39_13]|nr:hypothetical protein [Candidatus Pacearchaeota archaeon]OIO44292.1 MAG: hypothetical protein AUJ64_00335 [Candidatus Pacearchaeota archaeon CG1_02_39_14]PJC44352.1 MAG: hypothetical protein CO038_04025 [Candidatus Pacearchaeota archaeon CG_4_9_14_0_2_um_filter_39_13]